MYLIELQNTSILEQLQLEEALLRADDREWCIINTGSSPAIVMGISGQPERLLDTSLLKRDAIPVIKRYSGGGTVYIDEETIFVTFICNSKSQNVSPFPRSIMEWSENIYRPIFNHPEFALRENDYVIGEKKFGGNAQYIQKERWVHHTSFLWHFDPHKMRYLLLPEKRPSYRGNRSHKDFLCSLKDFHPEKSAFMKSLKTSLKLKFPLQADWNSVLSRPHRKGTSLLTF